MQRRIQRGDHRRRGETKVWVIVVIVVCVVVGMLLVTCIGAGIMLPALGKARATARQIKDGTQVRGIHQGLVLFAQNNGDTYPLPSKFDKNNTTISLAKDADPESKDTTANVISPLIYNGFFSTELCVSPAEQNANIVQMTNYSQSMPAAAAVPQQALWDPAFSADFTNGRKSNLSYAHTYFRGARRAVWGNTFQSDEAAIGNRGPLVSGVANQTPSFDTNSLTLLIHGGRTTWEGNIAYNDNHVNFETAMGMQRTITDKDGKTRYPLWDCLFFDDSTDDPTGMNNYLTIITENGKDEADVKTIWD